MRLLLWCLWAMLRSIATLRPYLLIAPKGVPYLRRWYLTPTRKGRFAKWWRNHLPGVFLHCFVASDPDRGWHSHPWHWASSLILRGEYFESRPLQWSSARSPLPREVWRHHAVGSINRIRRGDFHKVKLVSPVVWTLFVVGPLHGDEWAFMSEAGTITPHGTATPGD